MLVENTGLESLEFGAARIRVDDKKIINCHADLNQLVPFAYPWAWDKYLSSLNNNCNNLRSRKLSFSAPFFVYLALIIEFFRCY